MAIGTATSIFQEIENHRHKCGGSPSSWYAGIAADPEDRLFNEHGVTKGQDAWIYRDAGTSSASRAIEKALLDLGYDGGGGGGDGDTRYIYAYKKSYRTNP
ncbi:MAG: hypothetical protein PHO20_00845 [Candidatus Peribacteraceae bacterium]|nr:hypothetical protein [Candidatus Peribacteraceae bacterium]MDD5739297.1 hypothetical protein [Candidatus Peribacteraceae bacterium]